MNIQNNKGETALFKGNFMRKSIRLMHFKLKFELKSNF